LSGRILAGLLLPEPKTSLKCSIAALVSGNKLRSLEKKITFGTLFPLLVSRRQTNQTFNMKQLASSPGHTHSPSLQKWLHSDQAFTPDNDNKTEIKVNIMDSGGVVSYELHERRYWARPTLHVLWEQFRTTPSYADMNQRHIASVTASRLAKATHAAKSKHGSSQEEGRAGG